MWRPLLEYLGVTQAMSVDAGWPENLYGVDRGNPLIHRIIPEYAVFF